MARGGLGSIVGPRTLRAGARVTWFGAIYLVKA